jgi:hypothetical protein
MNEQTSPKKKKQNNPYLQFLNSLDKYKKYNKLNYSKGIGIQRLMQDNYIRNFHQYNQTHFPLYLNPSIVPSSPDPYILWQLQHETDIKIDQPQPQSLQNTQTQSNTNTTIKLKVAKKREKVIIQTNIESLGDILSIINTYPYEEDKDYNIDLKAIHKIKSEIQTLVSMIGLQTIKTSILRQLMYFIQGFADDPNDSDYKHTVFCGPPGTGKTEMAKLLGTMYAKLGVLKNNVFKKATRVDLVAGYLGQTAIKTQKLIDDCSGGVLFIDEAYSLQYDDSYAKECVDTLCEALSDRKHNLMVILAGYEADLENHIFRINPGLKSRFIWKFDIPPYSVGELFQILCNLCDKRGWSIEPNVNETWLEMKKNHFPDNGRSMEKLFSCSKIAHASRIYGKESSWRKKLSIDDLNKGFEMFQEYGNSKKENIYLGLYT